ncbi:VanZ family protein [Nocardioides sp. ChNu-153]|uniref:VanZ family protein n=1 Tax=unclassified Nocardioides TaxID=2615069 RepID=UPI0024066BE3|nr:MULTISPECIES: VanZ family protein [unclassified Nocardioides]MDF9715168.1 VanZ family protein [Nocardioides sp. ChNu-99]MDN7121053.1 VanZ family protein [Nocardioides sp. ChNu-153]
MVTYGGPAVMLLGAVLAGVVLAGAAVVAARRTGPVFAVAAAGFAWWVVVIALVTLVPAGGTTGWVAAETRAATCSFDVGGPAPDGFWIFDGGQRLLNTALFVPAGALGALAACRWRAGWGLVPLVAAGLALYSVGIEWTQLELARIDRACDVTDVIDNATGAALGAAGGVLLAVVLRPWRARRTP